MKYEVLTKERLEAILKDVYTPQSSFTPIRETALPELVDAPEGWEDNRRKELFEELPDGLYEFGGIGDKIQGWTGKGGKIDMQIALEKYLLGYK